MIKSMYLTVEIIVSTGIQEAILDAIALRDKLGVAIEFDFNGIEMFICESSTLENELKYYEEMNAK